MGGPPERGRPCLQPLVQSASSRKERRLRIEHPAVKPSAEPVLTGDGQIGLALARGLQVGTAELVRCKPCRRVAFEQVELIATAISDVFRDRLPFAGIPFGALEDLEECL